MHQDVKHLLLNAPGVTPGFFAFVVAEIPPGLAMTIADATEMARSSREGAVIRLPDPWSVWRWQHLPGHDLPGDPESYAAHLMDAEPIPVRQVVDWRDAPVDRDPEMTVLIQNRARSGPAQYIEVDPNGFRFVVEGAKTLGGGTVRFGLSTDHLASRPVSLEMLFGEDEVVIPDGVLDPLFHIEDSLGVKVMDRDAVHRMLCERIAGDDAEEASTPR